MCYCISGHRTVARHPFDMLIALSIPPRTINFDYRLVAQSPATKVRERENVWHKQYKRQNWYGRAGPEKGAFTRPPLDAVLSPNYTPGLIVLPKPSQIMLLALTNHSTRNRVSITRRDRMIRRSPRPPGRQRIGYLLFYQMLLMNRPHHEQMPDYILGYCIITVRGSAPDEYLYEKSRLGLDCV